MSPRIRSAVVAVGALSFALAACGGTPSTEAAPADPEPLALVEESSSVIDEPTSAGEGESADAEPTDEVEEADPEPRGASVELTSPAGLAAVCGGTGFSNLAPVTDEPRKIAFVESYRSADGAFSVAPDVSVGDARFDHVENDLLNLDYVGCIIEVSRDLSDLECSVTDADGVSVPFEVHELNLALRIVDAATGAEVAVEPIAASLDECPTDQADGQDVLAPVDPDGLLLAVESHLAR